MARNMLALLLMSVVVCPSVFVPGLALSSHFDSDGAPLSDLSWPSSLAVVAISLSGLFIFVFLMLACLCCKKGHIGFKEFENAEGEEFHAEQSTLASPVSQSGPDVYILPLTQVSLPVAKQPGRSAHLLKSTELCRHSLLYLREIGEGWFGKVLLAEVNAGLSTTQVVVKQLKSSASVQDQMHFLEEAQPYRALQHPALLQCLAQCSEVTPYLLVMELCPLGDVKGYLRSCRAADAVTPDTLTLQRMACDVASGLLHLHKHNFIHSDLALRNCLLTADVTVKIGDYGLSQNNYKEDYFVTSDQMYVPLRWIAPELIDEVHGNVLMVNQSKQSNVWSLGVTIWELFEMGNQPYRHYSDRQVLTYTVREQQLRLPKPLLKTPLAERWYEVMQFCWLQPDQRPTAEEVHLLLSYLCAKGASEAEEDFERRWNSLRPNLNAGHNSSLHRRSGTLVIDAPSSSSFPLLEQFSGCDSYHSESGDDILTVTETSHGLNFEYKWEQAGSGVGSGPEQTYPQGASCSSGTLGAINHHCQELYYPPGPGVVGPGGVGPGCGGAVMEGLTLGVSPSYYEPKALCGSGVVPVRSNHSPSVSSEYYIRIGEPGGDCHINMDLDYTMCSYSPDYQGSNGSFLTGSSSADSGECMMGVCPSLANSKPIDSYWSADIHKPGGGGVYDSDPDGSPISLTMEPLLGQVSDGSPLRPWETGHYISYKDRDGGYYYEHSPPMSVGHRQHYLMGLEPSGPEHHQESWGSRSLRQALAELENPLGTPASGTGSPQDAGSFGVGDPYLETSQTPGSIIGSSSITGGYYDMMGSLRKTMPGHAHSVSITMATEEALFISHQDSDSDEEDEEDDLFLERKIRSVSNTWPRKPSSANTTGLGLSLGRVRQGGCRQPQDAYVDFHYTMPTTDIEDSWPETFSQSVSSAAKPIDYMEATPAPGHLGLGKLQTMVPSEDVCNAYIYLCREGEETREVELPPIQCCHSHFVDPLTGLVVRNIIRDEYRDKMPSNEEDDVDLSPAPGGPAVSKSTLTNTLDRTEQYIHLAMDDTASLDYKHEVGTEDKGVLTDPKPHDVTTSSPPSSANVPGLGLVVPVEPELELSHTFDSGLDRHHCSSISLVDISDCCTDDDEDDDITDVTSGIFADEASIGELNASPSLSRPIKSLQEQVGTPDSIASMDLIPSVTGSTCEAFSPASSSSHPSSSSLKAMDSGYDTENNESPEFVPKEPHNETRDPELFSQHLGGSILDTSLDEEGEEGGEEAEVTAPEDDDESALDEDLVLATLQNTDIEKELTALSKNHPYRDSAYFSDYENERLSREERDDKIELCENVGVKKNLTEQKEISTLHIEEEEQGDELSPLHIKEEEEADELDPLHIEEEEEGDELDPLHIEEEEEGDELSPLHIKEEEEGDELDPLHIEEEEEGDELDPLHIDEEEEGDEERENSALPLEECEDPELEQCLKEDSPQYEGLLASSSSGQDEAELEVWPAHEEPLSLGDWAAEVVGAMEEALGELQRSSSIETSAEVVEEEEEEEEENKETERTDQKEASKVSEESSGEKHKTLEKDDYEDKESGSPSGRFYCSPSRPPPSTPPPPLPPMTPPPGRALHLDGEEADEEDGESDDSESDEELRTYSVQDEQSADEESEEENQVVPIVLSDCSEAQNLRSLLKMPTTLTAESLAGELLERKKKVVSFFDDVTVYLFDQQSPTKDLAEYGFPPGSDISGHGSEAKQPSSDDSDGNISEESAGYEWEDDFPLLPLPTSSSMMVIHASRFSITHVSDSDVDSGPGSSEDGDKE
ncbi:hypothetical protein UPYG_G00330050 [Umbra pygmaea]|uniref:non-specific serine/threonine protein kinase n=1 Tax=Umbra pygmaea TaxID=75934 RepID=A0ABD0W3K7_UMBPY